MHIHHDGTFYAHIHVMRDGNIQTLPLPIVNRPTPSRRSSYISSRLVDRVNAREQQLLLTISAATASVRCCGVTSLFIIITDIIVIA